MSREKIIVQYRTESGDAVSFISTDFNEVSEVLRGGEAPTRNGTIESASNTIESEIKNINPALRRIQEILTDINNPSELTLELGLEFTASTGIVVSNFSSKANIKVTLKWSNH